MTVSLDFFFFIRKLWAWQRVIQCLWESMNWATMLLWCWTYAIDLVSRRLKKKAITLQFLFVFTWWRKLGLYWKPTIILMGYQVNYNKDLSYIPTKGLSYWRSIFLNGALARTQRSEQMVWMSWEYGCHLSALGGQPDADPFGMKPLGWKPTAPKWDVLSLPWRETLRG